MNSKLNMQPLIDAGTDLKESARSAIEFMTVEEAIEIVLRLAQVSAQSKNDKLACDVVEDFAVNHLGYD